MKQRIITAAIAAPLFLILLYIGKIPFEILVMIMALVGASEIMTMSKGKKITLKYISIAYIVAGFIFLGLIRDEKGFAFTFAIMIIIWATDSGAYFVGKKIGKNKLAPSISPNKTVEGSIGGIVIAFVAVMIFQLIEPVFESYVELIIITLIVSVLGQIGDLIESKIKRIYDVKDSGKILPGHGGVFDRFDSMILVFIAVFIIEKINLF